MSVKQNNTSLSSLFDEENELENDSRITIDDSKRVDNESEISDGTGDDIVELHSDSNGEVEGTTSELNTTNNEANLVTSYFLEAHFEALSSHYSTSCEKLLKLEAEVIELEESLKKRLKAKQKIGSALELEVDEMVTKIQVFVTNINNMQEE